MLRSFTKPLFLTADRRSRCSLVRAAFALACCSVFPLLCPAQGLPPTGAQTGPPTGIQTGTQTSAQPGAQTGTQTTTQTGVLTAAQTGLLPGGTPEAGAPAGTPAAVQAAPAPKPAGGFPSLPGYLPISPNHPVVTPFQQPTLTPGILLLMELEGKFDQSVAKGGGKAFASWFADDAVTLNNGQPAVLGRANIAAQAQWTPEQYQLSWQPEGAQMGPSNAMGFTWGHYEGHSQDKNGQPIVLHGRYITVWKKQADGQWKVAMDASADEPAAPGACCTLPKP